MEKIKNVECYQILKKYQKWKKCRIVPNIKKYQNWKKGQMEEKVPNHEKNYKNANTNITLKRGNYLNNIKSYKDPLRPLLSLVTKSKLSILNLRKIRITYEKMCSQDFYNEFYFRNNELNIKF